MNKDIETLKLNLQTLKLEEKSIKNEIKTATQKLQTDLKEKTKQKNAVKKELDKIISKTLGDPSVHVIDRFVYWLKYADKVDSEWIMEGGPMRDALFDDEYRYSTVDVEGRLYDWFLNIGCYHFDIDDTEKSREVFDGLTEFQKEELTAIFEDAISQNISSMVYDW
jgi:hypothetical protein